MSDPMRPFTPKLVTVFGGSGFLGRFVVQALARRGYRVRVAVRRPDLAGDLQPLGVVGQIHAVQANLRYPASVRNAVQDADAVVNLVGILQETGRQTFGGVQTEGAGLVAETAAAAGAQLVHVSAIGADAESPSLYARTKAAGEARVREAHPEAIIMRPSIVFGPGDSFFNRFASLARALPVIPLAGADTRFQPVYGGDVAEAIARAVEGLVPAGRTYELGGPEVRTFRDLVGFALHEARRPRPILALPWRAAQAQALGLEILDKLTLGLLPDDLTLTRDQVTLLRTDNVVSDEAQAEGRTLPALGIKPTSVEAIVPAYLVRYRPKGQFDGKRREAAFDSPPVDVIAPESGGPGSGFQPRRASGTSSGVGMGQPLVDVNHEGHAEQRRE